MESGLLLSAGVEICHSWPLHSRWVYVKVDFLDGGWKGLGSWKFWGMSCCGEKARPETLLLWKEVAERSERRQLGIIDDSFVMVNSCYLYDDFPLSLKSNY